jgi:[protein-PII] uridylyltransferase
LALWKAQAETELGTNQLEVQKHKIFEAKSKKRQILSHLLKERKERNKRLDSIESFLEPQLKFGAGGLRDLFQGQVIRDLFPEKFSDSQHELNLLEYYRSFFLTVRQKLHFDGYSDILVASEQFEISRWMGFESHSEFMRQIQRGLARVSFYSEWVLIRAQASEAQIQLAEKIRFRKPEDLLLQLQKDDSVLSQYQVRSSLDEFEFPTSLRGKMLEKMFSEKTSDGALQAVFRSRLIDKIMPRIKHLVGLVQHDQYHRFTADEHLLQACREVRKLKNQPKLLGPLRKLHKQMSEVDWKILSWVALYHDLAKGLPGEHSEVGAQWVEKDLKAFGFSASFRREVAWLVKYHLELSIAAFRKNPQDPETWQGLQDLGLNTKRLLRLAFWTVMDIRATNPEAWNDWKAKLLLDLTVKIQAGSTQKFLKLKKHLPKGLSSAVVDALDPQLFEAFSVTTLGRDLETVFHDSGSWIVVRDSQKKLWFRYHQKVDQSGLLSELLEKIYASGASIQHALIHTLSEVGVYDWFQVQSGKDPAVLLKLLMQMKAGPVQAPQVQFMKISLVSQTDSEWVLSFRGVDQKGLLLAAALRLKELGAQIRSARVHTWGKQIEDLFQIEPLAQDPEIFLQKLRESLMS